MKFLVFGCNGMAGHTISLYLQMQGYIVNGFARKKSLCIPTILGDARDNRLVFETITLGDYDVAINCIGVLNEFAERDREAAVYLNAYFPHYLAKIAKDSNTVIVHISTDCVFSGDRGDYTEHDTPDGRTFYDRSKALGEVVNDKDITFRSSLVGPDLNPNGIGLMNWFLQQKSGVKGYVHAIWTGQTTLQLAKSIEKAVVARASGLYHLVPKQSISKYELLGLFNLYLRKNKIEIMRDESFRVDKSLKRINYKNFEYIIPDYETQIQELGDWIRMHKELYPHYDI